MRSSFAFVLVLAGCTTVVQEPADLGGEQVHELEIVQGDETNVRLVSESGWIEGGATVFVRNRLTGSLVSDRTRADGSLDVTIAGGVDDVYAVSRVADVPVAHAITTRDAATLPAFGWGFGGPSACERGEFAVGIVDPPAGADAHDACFAIAEATRFGDQDVFAVGTDSIAQRTEHAPVLRMRIRVEHGADVHVSVVTEDDAGTGHEFVGAITPQPEEIGSWIAPSFTADELQEHGGQPLYPGLRVLGIWIWVAIGAGLQVDDVVLESAVPL